MPVAQGKALVTVPPWARLPAFRPCRPRRVLAQAERDGEGFLLTAGDLRVRVDEKGQLTSYVLGDREMAAGPMNALRMYKDVPRLFDAWDIDSNYRECGFETPVVESMARGLRPGPCRVPDLDGPRGRLHHPARPFPCRWAARWSPLTPPWIGTSCTAC